MKTEYFNSATYEVVDKITGETVDMDVFIETTCSEYWEKAYAKTLSEYIGAPGIAVCKILAFIIKEKNIDNLILGTMPEIAEKTDTCLKSVKTTFVLLEKKGFLKRVRNGAYFLSPKIMSHGSKTRGAILIRAWDSIPSDKF